MIGLKTCLFASALGLIFGNSALGIADSLYANSSDSSSVTDSEANITDDLNKMGITSSAYPSVVGTTARDISFLSLVEWGYQPLDQCSSSYCLYLYIYNPSCDSLKHSGWLTMAPLGEDAEATSVSGYYSMRLTYCGSSHDNVFYKFRIDNSYASLLFPKLSSDIRRYLLGTLTVSDDAGDSFALPLGKEVDFTGFCKDTSNGISSSTLKGSVSDKVVIRTDVCPFVSDLGYFDFTKKWGDSCINSNSRIGLESHNVLFSLPKSVDKYGTLDSCHYDFFKYRTSWIFTTSNADDYKELYSFRGKKILNSDCTYPSNSLNLNPNFGFEFPCYFDSDDIQNDGTYQTDKQRFFNNNVDGITPSTVFLWKTRVDVPCWVFYDPYLVGTSLADNSHQGSDSVLDGSTLSSYFDSYGFNKSNSLPRKNGYCSSDLVYVPSYSKDSRFCKYGYVQENVSRSDLVGSAFSCLENQLDYSMSFISDKGYGYEYENAYEMFVDCYSKANSSKVPYVFGDRKTPMLDDAYDSDFMISNSFPSYKDSISGFMNSHSPDNVYRLTYDLSKTSSNVCVTGKSSSPSVFWTSENATASKTDVCLDFQFIDFTFKDSNNRYYTLPSSSDPFSTFGDVHQAYIPYLPTLVDYINDSFSKWFKDNPWIWAVVSVALLAVVIVLAKVFPPVFKALKDVFKFFVVLVYFFLIWWWYALLCALAKKPVPKLWFWKS